MDVFQIIFIILISVVIVLLLIFFILYLVKSSKKEEIKLDESNINNQLNNININLIKELSDFKEKTTIELNNYNDKLNEKFNLNNKEIQDLKDKTTEQINMNYKDLNDILNNNLNNINKKLEEKLHEGFNTNVDSLQKVNEALGKITESTKNLDDLNKEVSNLNEILSNSQKRGRYGEVVLESILDNVFGETQGLYDTQYCIKNNTRTVRPDAVIFMPENKVLCIDSKFSFNNYEKLFDSKNDDNSLKQTFKNELKSQIKKIKDDYIVKDITEIYAIMFIPSDGIFAYIQHDIELYEQVVEFARKLNVIICCPSTLQPIMSNIRALRLNYDIAKNIKEVIKTIEDLVKTVNLFEVRWGKLSKTIDDLSTNRNELDTSISTIKQKSNKINNLADKNKLLDNNNESVD